MEQQEKQPEGRTAHGTAKKHRTKESAQKHGTGVEAHCTRFSGENIPSEGRGRSKPVGVHPDRQGRRP